MSEEKSNENISLFEMFNGLAEIPNRLSKSIDSIAKNMENIREQFLPIFKKIGQWAEEYSDFEEYILSEWNQLDDELKTKNRYFPESNFIEIFKGFCIPEYLYSTVNIEEELYRARIYNRHEDTEEKDENFQGYGKKGSDAPPSSYSTTGRNNPNGISYLYTAQDLDTAISEIQPNVGQVVSVAKIRATTEIRIFDFEKIFDNQNSEEDSHEEFEEKAKNSLYAVIRFYSIMSKIFSTPSRGDSTNYYATQYISEFIKKEGFGGIRFKSSSNTGGSNIVLFDVSEQERKYEIISSSLHEIEEVKVTSKIVEESLL